MIIIRILLLMDNDANASNVHTCRTILMVADAEPEKRHKNQITLQAIRGEHDRMKCENPTTLETCAYTHP